MGEAACTEAPVFALLFLEDLGTLNCCCARVFLSLSTLLI